MGRINPDLLELLACPACHSSIFEDGAALQCANPQCRRQYPVRDGVPVMLIAESTTVDAARFDEAMKRRTAAAGAGKTSHSA